MPTLTLPPFEPHPGQRRILRAAKKRTVACMGRRYGKTTLMKEVVINRPGGALAGINGTGRYGLPCAWYAPNDSYSSRVYQEIAQQYMPAIRKATSQPRPVIEFINGGRLDFWTLENPMKCGRGAHYARIVVDEAAHARHLQDAWEKTIIWTLADLDGDAYFISTPNGMNYFHQLSLNHLADDAWTTISAPSMDNPYLPEGWMEQQRAMMPERVYRQEILAEFLDSGAGVFRGVDEIEHCSWEDQAADGFRYVIGVDWARHNDFTVFTVVRHDGCVVNIDRFNGIGYELQTGRLLNLWRAFGQCRIIAESNSMGSPLIEKLQRMNVNVHAFNTTNASKADAIESLSLAIEQRKIRIAFDERMTPLKAELVCFDQERLPSGAIRYSAPPGMHDDCVMSLAIAWDGVKFAQPMPDYSRSGIYTGAHK